MFLDSWPLSPDLVLGVYLFHWAIVPPPNLPGSLYLVVTVGSVDPAIFQKLSAIPLKSPNTHLPMT